MNPANTGQARMDLIGCPGAQAVGAKCEALTCAPRALCTEGSDRPVRSLAFAAHLDVCDLDRGAQSDYRVERYRRHVSTDITNDAAPQMHLADAEALVPRVVPGGLIVIHERSPEEDGFAAKGATAVPAHLRAGYAIVDRTTTAIALERSGAI